MGEAARILAQDTRGEFRDMIHDEVDKWVDQIIDEVFVDGKEPTVMEIYLPYKNEALGGMVGKGNRKRNARDPLRDIQRHL